MIRNTIDNIHVQYVSGMDLHSGTTSSDSASYFSEMSKSSRASDSRRNPRRNVRDKGIGQQLQTAREKLIFENFCHVFHSLQVTYLLLL